jgi:cytochrome c-type biogenesis protein CcsB
MMRHSRLLHIAAIALAMALWTGPLQAQEEVADEHAGHVHEPSRPRVPVQNFLAEGSHDALRGLSVQDFQGRMKPLDTLTREMVMKITKRSSFEGWRPLDLYLSWALDAAYWFDKPLIAVRFPALKERLGIPEATKHVSAASLLDAQGKYVLSEDVEAALRTDNRERSKLQRKLLSFDERVNLIFMNFQRGTLRLYPLPGDEKDSWLTYENLRERMGASTEFADFERADATLWSALGRNDDGEIQASAAVLDGLQRRHGSAVVVSDAALAAEIKLNENHYFMRLTLPYLLAWLLMLVAYVNSLARRKGAGYSLKQPLYLLGSLVYWAAMATHLYAFILRWVASGRAPISNGYESLIWISLMVALAGLLFELKDRKAVIASLGALLTAVVLGVSMLSTFDPAIGPLVPVLASYWLNIHVTVITSSYGFLGLAALMAMSILILHLFKGPGRNTVREAIQSLHGMHWYMIIAGLGLLSIGTLLGGVWANESWGRYWGWDAKETWSLVTILVYAIVSHFRFIKGVNGAWFMATASFLAVSSIIMTYFGVNYFLAGLHSYAGGEAATVPNWAYVAVAIALVLIMVSGLVNNSRRWEDVA